MVFVVAALICCVRPPCSFASLEPLVRLLDALVLFTIMSVVGAVASYVIMADSHGFVDASLDHADRMMGFSAPAFYAVVQRHPWLNMLLLRAYLAFSWLPFLVFALLYRARRMDHLYRYILANGLALFATLATFCVFPAKATFAFYQGRGMLPPTEIRSYEITIAGLRDGSLHALDFTHFDGIITFPSFHAAMAILFVWGAWPGARLWRAPLLAINILMWVSAVPIGGHYGVDLIGGTLVAAGAIALANRVSLSGRSASNVRPIAALAAT